MPGFAEMLKLGANTADKARGMFGEIGNKFKGAVGDVGAIKTILHKVSNPDTFLATFAGNDVDSKTKYIDDVVTLSKAGSVISSMPGAPTIPEINNTMRDNINTLVNDDGFKKIISEINTNADLKDKVMLKLSDGKSTVKFASGLMANLQAGNIDSVTEIIKAEFNKIKDESVATTRPYENVKSGDPDAPINDENLPVAHAVVVVDDEKDEEEEEKIKNIFQELINKSLENPESTLYKKIVEINAAGNDILIDKLLKALPGTLNISEGQKVRFIKDLKDKLDENEVTGGRGGKKTRRKRKRKRGKGTGTKRKNVTKRRK